MTSLLDAPVVQTVPAVTVRLGGTELSAAAAATLGPVRIRREASRPAACEVDIAMDTETRSVAPGDELTVTVGGTSLFRGEVVATERRLGPDRQSRLLVRGFDASHALRNRTDVTTHTDLTVAGLAEALAGHAGLQVDAMAEGPRRGLLLQTGESDLTLLNRCCAAAGLWWRLDGTTLRLRGTDPESVRTVTWGDELIEAVLGQDATGPDGPVHALSWDPATRRGVDGASNGSGNGRTILAPLLEDTSLAEALARAEAGRRDAAATWVRAVLHGDAAWLPGLGLRLDDDPSGETYLLRTVEHVVDAVSGWVTLVDSRPTPEPMATGGGLVLLPGVVTDVDDPESAGRVKVRFEVLGDTDSDWLPVLGLGASHDKGFTCQPDVGDTVAVLQPANAYGHGIVLGGIQTGAAEDAAGVHAGSVRRMGLATPDGQRLSLDRDTDAATLRNKAGSRLEITETGVILHAEADLTISAPGRRLLIQADTVDFERA